MKATIEPNPEYKETLTLPVMMEFINTNGKGIVVLFGERKNGTIVHPGASSRKVGELARELIPFDDRSAWKKFTGKIILEN